METCLSGSEGEIGNPVISITTGAWFLPYGAEITIAATKVPAFKPGKQLKEEVNKGAAEAKKKESEEAAAKDESTQA
jgi:hypothetical protein